MTDQMAARLNGSGNLDSGNIYSMADHSRAG